MTGRTSRADRLWARAAGVTLALFGFLPIANWLKGGRSWPRYGDDVEGWLAGTAIVFGVGVLYLIVARRAPVLWRNDAAAALIRHWVHRPKRANALLAITALAVYSAVAKFVFSGRPLLVDEVAQLFQARQFAQGRIAATLDAVPELFSALHLVERNGLVFSQFPPGGPAVLAVGVLFGAAWLAVPVCGALAVWSFALLARRIETDRPGVSLAAALIFAFAPFMVFTAASHMNHVPTLLGIVVALLALERLTSSDVTGASARWWALACGSALGVSATIRPVDAAAFAAPIALWLVARAARDRRLISPLLLSGVGVAVPVVLMLVFNLYTTGDPTLFGYQALWGRGHDLGFHTVPWGAAHTPARGLELVSLYLLRLQTYLFETPVPSLAACIGALLIAGRLRRFDRLLFVTAACLVALYFAYWHDGFYLGPRFVVCLLPMLALWSARLLPEWRARWGRGAAYRVVVVASVASIAIALLVSIPLRASQYHRVLKSMRWDVRAAERAAGVRNAIVFVRESWGAQLMVRLWAVGVSHQEAQALYGKVDACALERGLDSLERTGGRDSVARSVLLPLLIDSARVVKSPFSADSTERVLPGSTYGARCVGRLEEDRAGFTVYLPLIVAGSKDVVYARDLHARDSLLLARYPSRAVFLLRPDSDREGAPPRFWPLSRDSLRAAWAQPDPL